MISTVRRFVLPAAVLLCAASPVAATSYVMVSDEALADQASFIVEAEVVSASPAPTPARAATDYLIDVERVIKGFVPGSSLIVRVPGVDRPSGLSLRLWGMPELRSGDRVLLFLVANQDGSFGLLHLMLGTFYRFAVDGQTFALRNLEEAVEVANPRSGKRATREHEPRDYQAFVDWLGARAEGERRPADYFVPQAAKGLTSLFDKFTIIRDSATGLNLRWFEFDTGGQVGWFAHQSGQNGIAGGGFAQFQTALAAWNTDPVTPILLTYRGTTSSTGGFDDTGDGRNTLLFNDPNQEISGTFDCNSGGVLAIGGPRYDRDFRGNFNGRQYIRTLEAEIITNDGIQCFFAESVTPTKALEEVLAHELGHTLGLGHACGDSQSPNCRLNPPLDDALMRASAHDDGRGARLAADDLAASRSLYRSNGGGGGGGSGAPAAPSQLTAELDGLVAALAWQDNASNEAGYRVYRRTGNGAFSLVAELPAGSTAYRDESLAASTSYGFQVGAYNAAGERKSNTVTVETPAARLVTASLEPAAVTATAGVPVQLRVAFTGPAVRAEWQLGPERLAFSGAPCDASHFCATVLVKSSGTLPLTVSVVGDLGQRANASGSLTVSGTAANLVAERSFIQSVIFGPRGDTGTFASNCWTHNAGGTAALVTSTYLRRGAGNPSPPSREVSLAAGTSVFLPNIVHELFGETDSQGAIELAYEGPGPTAPDVRTICRSFVEVRGGTGSFGLFSSENPEASWTSAPKVVGGVLQDAAFGASLLAVNVDDVPGSVFVELTDANGQTVGSPQAFALSARSVRSRPLAQMFPQVSERPSPFTARFTSSGIRFLASTTLLEGTSEDQVFASAREADTADTLFVPRVSHAQSQFDAFLVSQLILTNNSAQPTSLVIELWRRGQSNLNPPMVNRTLAGNATLVFDDVLADLFGLTDTVGALRIRWSNGENKAPRVQTYSFNQSAGGQGPRFGMLVDSQAAASATTGTSVDFGAEQSALFRADFGILNLGTGGTNVRVTLKNAAGLPLATADLGLQPQQHLERNLEGIFRDVTIGLGANWTVETQVLAGGPILTYLANINASGDIFFVPGRAQR